MRIQLALGYSGPASVHLAPELVTVSQQGRGRESKQEERTEWRRELKEAARSFSFHVPSFTFLLLKWQVIREVRLTKYPPGILTPNYHRRARQFRHVKLFVE